MIRERPGARRAPPQAPTPPGPAARKTSRASYNPRLPGDLVTSRTLFLTGASGFVGRSLLPRLAPLRAAGGGREGWDVRALSRNVGAAGHKSVRYVQGDLLRSADWADALRGVDACVHLAAMTGKARPEEYRRINVEGTRELVDACSRAGVKRFVHVSTIAATYPETEAYPYARTKADAERVVRESDLDWAILRPTIVLGKRSPVGKALLKLAGLPLIPMFGDGAVKVQPIHVDDVAEAIATCLEAPELVRDAFDLGGPEVLPFRELLHRLREAHKGSRGTALRLPLKATMSVLAGVEGPLLSVLPLTAGQLYAFQYDSTARANPLQERIAGTLRDVDTMLRELVPHA